jgi:hypothetical protein
MTAPAAVNGLGAVPHPWRSWGHVDGLTDGLRPASEGGLGGPRWTGSFGDLWSRHSDLNRGPAVYETAALPLSYVGRADSVPSPAELEPAPIRLHAVKFLYDFTDLVKSSSSYTTLVLMPSSDPLGMTEGNPLRALIEGCLDAWPEAKQGHQGT